MTSETAQPIPIDKTYYFEDDKRLTSCSVPDEARELVEQLDANYAKAPASHFDRIIRAIRPQVKEGAPPYAIFDDWGSSKETALIVPLPYCNPIVPDVMDPTIVVGAIRQGRKKEFDSNTWNNAEKHLFLFEAMKALGIRDEAGKTIPVIAVTADSQDYRPVLDKEDKMSIKGGHLEVYTRNLVDILQHTGHGRIHVSGYSQGASIAHEFLAWHDDFDIESAVIAEPPTYKDRSIRKLIPDYLTDKNLRPEIPWTADGPQSRRDLEEIRNRAFATMSQTIFRRNGAWRVAFGLTHGTMIPDLAIASGAGRQAFPLTISWNETSTLTHDIEPELFEPDPDKYFERAVLNVFNRDGMLRTVKALGDKAVGAPHLAGESPMYYSLMIGESIQWAQSLGV